VHAAIFIHQTTINHHPQHPPVLPSHTTVRASRPASSSSSSPRFACSIHASTGAAAIAHLLALRGNGNLSRLITASGKIGDNVYHWVATHRNSLVINVLTLILERLAR
jgi:hypothetical protein